MRSFLVLGAAALVSASPAPQELQFGSLDSLPAPAKEGPPVGPGVAEQVGYVQGQAQAAAASAATGVATAQMAKRTADADVERRWLLNWWQPKEPSHPAPTPAPTPAPQPQPPAEVTSSTNTAPSSCTPVSWTNTWAFTSIAACPTAIEVGTYCGFINPLDPCAAQPNAYGPPTTPDTVDAFENNPTYHELAQSAKTPSGYSKSFTDLDGSMQGAGYLGYKILTSYSPQECADYCDKTDTCTGFNIFIERDPKFNPEQCSCQSPSITQFKCSIWGQEVKPEAATNKGQNQAGFDVVVVGSNGYNKATYNPPTPPSCSRPTNCHEKLHNHQPYCMGEKTFPGPYDPSVCAAYAQSQNEKNKKAGLLSSLLSLFGMSKGGCVQFQASYLEKNGKGFGTNCRLFTKKFPSWDANLDVHQKNPSWGCQKSYTWDLDVNGIFNWGAGW